MAQRPTSRPNFAFIPRKSNLTAAAGPPRSFVGHFSLNQPDRIPEVPMHDEVGKNQGNVVPLQVDAMVGHPVHVGVIVREIFPVDAVAHHLVVVGVQGVQVWGIPLGQSKAVSIGGGGQCHDCQVRPVVLQQLRGHETAEGYANEHGAARELVGRGDNFGVVFLSRSGRKIEEDNLRRVGQAWEHGVPQQLDGAVGTAALVLHEEDVIRHRSHRASL